MANQQNQTEGMENMGLNSIDIATVSDGYETNQLLSDIRKEEARQLSDQRDQLQYDFDEYILGGTGEALDMDRVETYKNQVEPRRFQESLYKLQESTYAMAPSFGTPVLEKYVGDDPRAYKDFEAHQNREADLYWAGRIQDYHYGIFTYDSRADYPTLDDETYETMGTGGYLSELYNVPIDDVMDNMPTYLGMYADSKKLDEATPNAVFDHIKNDVFEQGESMKRDEQYWVEGLDMALRGDSIEKTLGLREINKDNKRQAQVYRMAADHIYGEYGDNIAKAKDYLLQLGRGDTTAKTLDALEPQGAEIRKRSEMADRLLEESPENRQQIMGLIFKLAELEGGEVEGAIDRVAKSLGRAFGATVEDIGSGSARFNMGAFIPDFIEPEDDQIEKNRTQRRELMQDLRMARNTYRDITAQGTTEMIAQTTASNIHYMGMFALGPAGVGLMSLDMASKADEQYRMEYPDMDADTRWGLSSAKGIIDAGIEKIKVGALFGGFPSLTKFIGGSGVKRAAGVLGVRVAAAQGVQYVEESAQGMTYPILHKMWVAAGADIPDVDQEVWARDFWMMEEGDRVPFWDADLFVSMLGLSILTSGGRGAYDKFGGKKVKEMLGDVDKVMMTGYTRKEAEDIVNLNETDTTRAFEQFQDGLADRSKTERKANMDQAKAEGADRRILKTEMDEFKKEIEATGSEEAKRDLRIREVQYDFAMKYDAHLEERDDGKFEMVSPDAEVSPSKVFDTKEEADEAMLQHYQRVDQAFLGSLAEQQERIETLSKNKKAMKLAAKELSTEHSKAGVEADIKLDQDASTLADFAAKGEAEMKTALERVQHELLRKGILRPATVKDFKDWQINAQVQLQKDGRGYVERVSKGGNIADVYEDASEGFLKTMIHKNVVSKDWVKEQIFNYQRDTGDILVDAKSPKDISDLRMTEAFSDLAKANLWNASKDNKTGKLAGLIRALKQYFKSVLNAAENLLKLQAEGKIESDFQTLLDQSVGLNMDQQIERQTVEAQQEILDEASMSIMPASDGKPYKDRDGDEAGAPLTETEIQEGIEDESGTLADVDIDTDRLADIGFDSSFSIAKESEWKTLTPEDVRGKKLFAFYADRMRVGTYTGLNPKSGISIAMQGGIDYPQAHKGAAWAVSSDPMHTSIANAADAKDGIALVLAYQTGNVTGNETFADAYIEELKWSIKSGDITEADALAILNKVRAESVKLYQTKQKRDQRIEDAIAAEKGRAPLTKAVAPWVVNNASDWKSVDEFFDSLTNEGATFDSRGQKMFKTGFDANGVVTAQKLGSQANVKKGMPDVAEMVKLMEVEGSSDINYGDVMGLVQIDKGQAGNAVDAETLGVDPHRSYPKILTGKPYGKLPKRTNILDIFDPRKGVVPMAGEVLKFKDEGVVATLEETSFSITPAQDAAYMEAVESGDVETQQRMVDERIDQSTYNTRVKRGDGKAFDVFDKSRRGESTKAASAKKAFFFTDAESPARTFAWMAANNEAEVHMRDEQKQFAIEENSAWEDAEADILAYANDSKTDPKIAEFIKAYDEAKDTRQPMVAGVAEQNNYFGSENVERWVNAYRSIVSEASPQWLTYRQDTKKKLGLEDKGIVRDFVLNLNNYIEIDYKGESSRGGEITYADAIDKAEAEGRDGVVFRNTQDAGEVINIYAVFNPNQIKLSDPVTYDADGNVIPLSQRFDASRDEVSMSLAQAEDPVMSKIRSLMRDPEMREEVYRSMSERLQRVRDRVYAKHIAFGETTAESMKDADRQMSDREFITSSVAQVQAIVNVLPMEVRGKAGSILEIVKRSSSRGVTNELMKKIDKIDSILDKYMSDGYLDKLNKSRKQGKLKKGKQEKIARGTITAIKHNELDLIEGVLALSDAEVDADIVKNEAVLTNPQTTEAEANDAVVNIIRLQTYGKLEREGKRPQANAMVMKEASEQLANLIREGKAAYAVLQEDKKERRAGMKEEMLDVVSGGKGIPDDNTKSISRRKRKKQGFRNLMLSGKAKMNSWEHLVEHLSRLDPSPSMEGRLRVWTEKVHEATHAEQRTVAEKQVAFERAVGEIYGVDTSKRGWHGKTLVHFERLSEQVERNIGKPFSNSKQTVSVKADHAAELVAGLHTKILVKEGMVSITQADLKALQKAMEKNPKAKTFKFERQEHKNIQNIHLSVDEILNLTMLYGQEGYKDLMHFHGYSAEVMETLEGELSEQDKQVRSYMLDYNDKNYDHFNSVYSKIFGANMRKVKGYSKASFEHQGMQPVELMDSDGAKPKSITPAAGMARIQHLAKPKQDAGATQLFLQGMSETEHFVAWGELVGDMRATFLNKDVQDTIEVNHGNEIKNQINESINEFTQGGVVVGINNKWKYLDKLRSDFTVMALSYKWSIMLKQMTSLPAYASHIPVGDYIKYQAEFVTSWDNIKKMSTLPYVKHRFNHGHDRDVMMILSHSGSKKSKLEKVVDLGMKGVSIGDIVPVIAGGYAAYRHGYEKAKKANPNAGEAHFEARGILAFEMLTDNAQQAGNLKDMSGFAKGGSIARVFTMFTTSLVQYGNNSSTAIMDVLAGKVDSKKKLAKIAAINHVILPSTFYWVSWATANAFKSDDEDETAKEALRGWLAAMALGPLSGIPVLGKALGSLASGYKYEVPVFGGFKSAGMAANNAWDMLSDEDITPDEILEAFDHTADAFSYLYGKGLGKAYIVSQNVAKSLGFDRNDARRMAMNEVDGAVHDLAELHKAIYAEPMPDKEDKAAYRQAERERWISLADEYSFVKGETEDSWEKIAEKLKKKNLLPQKVEKLMK